MPDSILLPAGPFHWHRLAFMGIARAYRRSAPQILPDDIHRYTSVNILFGDALPVAAGTMRKDRHLSAFVGISQFRNA
jgi:hypothetical protein